MKTASMIGSMIVTIALIFYSVGFAKGNRKKLVNSQVLFFYSIGVSLDITATIFMIIGSSKGLLTLHGIIGYSALLGMLTDTIFLWTHKIKKGTELKVSRFVQLYSRVTYSWWIVAYITGGLLVAAGKIMG
jgi:hypothetical protein